MSTVYLALGSNLGDRAHNLRRALRALPPPVRVTAVSRCYETEPAYVLDQPRFYNLVCRGETDLDPDTLLKCLKTLEASLGRAAGQRYGPRLLDLDLLLYDALVLNAAGLTVPHPRLAERAFVLVPLEELAADVVHPSLGYTIADLRRRLGETDHLLWLAPECNEALAARDDPA